MGANQLVRPVHARKGHERMAQAVTYVDMELAEIGTQLRDLSDQKRQIEKHIRELELRQEKRLKLVGGLDHVHNFPTKQQAAVISTFKLALQQTNPIMLSVSFHLCQQTGADRTNWRSEHGESVEVAFQRRLTELEQGT